MNEPIIQLKDLSKHYGSLTAVDNLNLHINKGEIFGLLGPNGAGKTTSILMMLGLSEPSGGVALVCGENATRNPIRVKSRVGYLPDNVGFYDNMTALENLVFIARLNKLTPTEAESRAREVLGKVGLSAVVDKAVGTFSRGMKQRLGLADVLIKKPEVVILDEPTLGIDPSGVNEFLSMIKELSREEGLTVLLSSHHLHQVQRVCDRIGIFVAGKLLVEGSIDDLTTQLLGKDGFTTTVGYEENMPLAEPILQAIRALASVQDVTTTAQHLEVQSHQDITPHIVRTLVEHAVSIRSVQRKTYDLDDIYEKYFEGSAADNSIKEATHKKVRKSIFNRKNRNTDN